MSYKDRMRVSPSNAEILLRDVCTRHNLHPEFDVEICLMITVPDQYYRATPFRQMLPFYLDGIEVHSTFRQTVRDDTINSLLTTQRTPPLRIRYHPPLSKRKAEQCYKLIKETLERKLTQPRLEEV